jgi:hypothetical protein
VTVGFRVYAHAHHPCPASLPVRVPAAVPLLPASFSLGLTAAALRFTTVAVTASGHHVSDNEFVFMSGTRAAGQESPGPEMKTGFLRLFTAIVLAVCLAKTGTGQDRMDAPRLKRGDTVYATENGFSAAVTDAGLRDLRDAQTGQRKACCEPDLIYRLPT